MSSGLPWVTCCVRTHFKVSEPRAMRRPRRKNLFTYVHSAVFNSRRYMSMYIAVGGKDRRPASGPPYLTATSVNQCSTTNALTATSAIPLTTQPITCPKLNATGGRVGARHFSVHMSQTLVPSLSQALNRVASSTMGAMLLAQRAEATTKANFDKSHASETTQQVCTSTHKGASTW